MKSKIILLSSICLISTLQALVTFSPGQTAKAEDFNNNFSELSDKITTINNRIYSTPPNAKVNGVDTYVYTYSIGQYSFETSTGINVTVEENGLPYNNYLYYESSDCSGEPYIGLRIEEKEKGFTYINPKITSNIQMAYLSGKTMYSDYEEIVKLNYNSYTDNSFSCSTRSSTTMASLLKANDISITGISFPVLITEMGTPMSVTDEIGTKKEDNYLGEKIVYANGVRIGVSAYLSLSADFPVRVILDDYPEERVEMYKDGTYSGLDIARKENIYYLTSDCSGNGYIKVLNDFDKEWWISSYLKGSDIINNDQYYKTSSTIYKITNGTKSYKGYYSPTCNVSTDTTKSAYKQATQIATPNFPTYTGPITIESVVEDINYDSLSEAN